MTKYQLLTIYELARLMLFLSIATKAEQPFGWYIAAPLLCIPFLLLYLMKASAKNHEADEDISEVQRISSLLFSIQKLATSTGIVFFTIQFFKNITGIFSNEDTYFLEKLSYIVIFFVIDVIISIVIIKKSKRSEG